jgi:serine/threonine-protein kinase
MADVYLIWNPRMEVYRAVKVLKPDMPERLLDRFETEIRIFSSLNHANIVQCYSVGEWYSLPYLEMEYVPGTAMDELLTMLGRLTPSQVCAIGILVCRALDYAHNQNVTVYGKTYRGVIHRDLKPANILLGHNGLVKLTDFGIARPTEVGLHTMDTHKVVGTLPYLAPEQCQGQEITALTDVYALGETLYELASGQRAFPQSDIMTCATAKTKGRIEPLADSLELPCGLVEVIDRSLAVKPEERFSSAGDMGRHLERVFRGIVKGDSRKVLPGLARHYWGERQNPEAPTGGAET